MTDVNSSLSDEQITIYANKPISIETYEVAMEVITCLENEVDCIEAKLECANQESKSTPMTDANKIWFKRASFAAEIRKKQIVRVKNRASEFFQKPKAVDAEMLKQRRLLVEAKNLDKQRTQKQLIHEERLSVISLRAQRLEIEGNQLWNRAIELCASIIDQSQISNDKIVELSRAIRSKKKVEIVRVDV